MWKENLRSGFSGFPGVARSPKRVGAPEGCGDAHSTGGRTHDVLRILRRNSATKVPFASTSLSPNIHLQTKLRKSLTPHNPILNPMPKPGSRIPIRIPEFPPLQFRPLDRQKSIRTTCYNELWDVGVWSIVIEIYCAKYLRHCSVFKG